QPFQVLQPNPLASAKMIPGAWSDPLHPSPQMGVPLQAVAFVPNPTEFGLSGPPPFGWPVIVFGHGLTRHKEDLFAIASQFAAAGFRPIAIYIQAHGSRAGPISKDPAAGCAGSCMTSAAACDTLTPCGPGDTCIT